ncbi:MAG: 30S ribosomal protein S4e [Nitrososphaeraceae archaeon]
MGNKGGQTILKRQSAPVFWNIRRKEGRFIPRISPGPHSKERAYALGVILRDVLKSVKNMNEVKKVLNEGKIKVDNVPRYSPKFASGLMDTIELIPSKQIYRLVPKHSSLLYPIEIDEGEKHLKLVKVMRKNIIHGNKIQYGFHDGKTLLSDKEFKVGDSCLLKTPELEILEHFKLAENCLILIIRGDNAGKIGRVKEIKQGTFSLPKRVIALFESKSLEIPLDMIMIVGNENDEPRIKVS